LYERLSADMVEAMHHLLILRIFKIFAVRHHAESAFFEVATLQKSYSK